MTITSEQPSRPPRREKGFATRGRRPGGTDRLEHVPLEEPGWDQAWRDVLAAAGPWDPGDATTMVVVPHPDDEVVSTGGLIARLRRRGADVMIVAVTDGEAADAVLDGVELARVRRREQRDALEQLSVPRQTIRRLEFDDGRVGAEEAELTDLLERLIAAHGVGQVVAPWVHDHHSDHEACGRAAATACSRAGIRLAGGLFWAYHHTDPATARSATFGALELTPDERALKQLALACHRSQINDPACGARLTKRDLAPARWPCEYFVLDQPLPATSAISPSN